MRKGARFAVLIAVLASGAATAADLPMSALVAGTPLERMAPDTFASAGLQKLSPQELQYLGRWMAVYMQAASAPTIGDGLIKSHIDGEFKGWEGETVYKLMNGQIWQQASYHYHYHYAFNPEVLIYSSSGSYKIRVQGYEDDDVPVKRLN